MIHFGIPIPPARESNFILAREADSSFEMQLRLPLLDKLHRLYNIQKYVYTDVNNDIVMEATYKDGQWIDTTERAREIERCKKILAEADNIIKRAREVGEVQIDDEPMDDINFEDVDDDDEYDEVLDDYETMEPEEFLAKYL